MQNGSRLSMLMNTHTHDQAAQDERVFQKSAHEPLIA